MNKKYELRFDDQDMRDAYCDALISAGEQNEQIVSLDCDLANSMGTARFKKRFPERAFDLGIMEANACSMAAGLSVVGFVPFVHSFATFASRRILDQIFLSCAYAGLNVKIIGGDAGVSAAVNGGTHMAFEYFGALRSIPHIRLFEPTDNTMVKALIPQIAASYGVDYVRMPRRKVVKIYECGETFIPGKAKLLREGIDVTLIASGILVAEALKAAELLASRGVQARVVDMFTIKPIDLDCVRKCAEKTGCVVTAENTASSGVWAAPCGSAGRNAPVPWSASELKKLGEVGSRIT